MNIKKEKHNFLNIDINRFLNVKNILVNLINLETS